MSCFLLACMQTAKSSAPSAGTGSSEGPARNVPPAAARSLPTSTIISLGFSPGLWSTKQKRMAASERPGSLVVTWKQPAWDASCWETFFSTEYSCRAPSAGPPAGPALMPATMSHL